MTNTLFVATAIMMAATQPRAASLSLMRLHLRRLHLQHPRHFACVAAAGGGGRTATTINPDRAADSPGDGGKPQKKKMIDLQPPKGTRDFPPEEMRARNW